MKYLGMVVGKLKLDPETRPIWVWLGSCWPLKILLYLKRSRLYYWPLYRKGACVSREEIKRKNGNNSAFLLSCLLVHLKRYFDC